MSQSQPQSQSHRALSSNFQPIVNNALKEYEKAEKRTKKGLLVLYSLYCIARLDLTHIFIFDMTIENISSDQNDAVNLVRPEAHGSTVQVRAASKLSVYAVIINFLILLTRVVMVSRL
jgi:hypothetical protein